MFKIRLYKTSKCWGEWEDLSGEGTTDGGSWAVFQMVYVGGTYFRLEFGMGIRTLGGGV